MAAKKSAKKPATCKCVETVNKSLEKHNSRIAQGFQINFANPARSGTTPPLLMLHKIDDRKRTKMPSVICVYCPFCGEKYPA